MRVKPSHQRILSHLGITLLASASLTACQSSSSGISDVWRDVRGEREPQVVAGVRRAPILNKQYSQPAGSIKQASPAYNSSYGASSPPAQDPYAKAYENQPEYRQPAGGYQEEPYLLDRVTSWFSSQFDGSDNTTPQTPKSDAAMMLASNASVGALDVPPLDERKPVASNPVAVVTKEPDMQLAEVTLPAKITPIPIANKTPSRTDEILSALETAPTPPLQVAEAQKEEIIFPWADDAPLNTPRPQTPTTPTQLSAMMPAAGGRKEQASLTVDEVSEEEFASIVNQDSAAEFSPAISELGMGGPFMQSAEDADEEETLLASSSDMTLAAAEPEYPPLTSVPEVPPRIKEVRAEHPAVKQDLEMDKAQSDVKRQQVQEQIQQEADESLLRSVPETKLAPAAGGAHGMLAALPPVQFDDPRWSGPRIVSAGRLPMATIRPVAHIIEKRVPMEEVQTLVEKVMDSISILPAYTSLPIMNEQREVAYEPMQMNQLAL